MKLSTTSTTNIHSIIKEIVNKYSRANCGSTLITDIHLQPKISTGELIIFDDDDQEIATTTIEEWIEYSADDFYQKVERCLSSILSKEKDNGSFENLCILTPYSFVLVDEEKETIAEILLVDDDTLLLNDELLKGLDKELDDFLKDLLDI